LSIKLVQSQSRKPEKQLDEDSEDATLWFNAGRFRDESQRSPLTLRFKAGVRMKVCWPFAAGLPQRNISSGECETTARGAAGNAAVKLKVGCARRVRAGK